MRYWQRTDDKLPDEWVQVETISPGGLQQELTYRDGLWFLSDDSMYVYYVPEFWRYRS